MCDAVREQIDKEPVKAELTLPTKKKCRGEPTKKKFSLPLTHPLCDSTTNFSKFINKKKPHLSKKTLQRAAHLTNIAWQKKSHYKYFKDRSIYKKFYEILRVTKCARIALSVVLHTHIPAKQAGAMAEGWRGAHCSE
jgi:hypothetical protein